MILKSKNLVDGYTLNLLVGKTGREALAITYPGTKKIYAIRFDFSYSNYEPEDLFDMTDYLSEISGFNILHGTAELE